MEFLILDICESFDVLILDLILDIHGILNIFFILDLILNICGILDIQPCGLIIRWLGTMFPHEGNPEIW